MNPQLTSWLHATDCDNETGEFFGKERPLRDSLLNGLSDVIVDLDPILVSSALIRGDWDAVATAEFKNRFEDPYYFCFENCLQQISRWSAAHAGGEPVALVFAIQEEYKERHSFLYKKYLASPAYPAFRVIFLQPTTMPVSTPSSRFGLSGTQGALSQEPRPEASDVSKI